MEKVLCELCGEMFSTKCNLKRHERTKHSAAVLIKCNIELLKHRRRMHSTQRKVKKPLKDHFKIIKSVRRYENEDEGNLILEEFLKKVEEKTAPRLKKNVN